MKKYIFVVGVFLLSTTLVNGQFFHTLGKLFNPYDNDCRSSKKILTVEEGPPCNNSLYYLVFEEKFNDRELNTNRWQVIPHQQGNLKGDQTQEYNTLENCSLVNGNLVISAKRENVARRAYNWKGDFDINSDGQQNLRNYEYTSANIWTNKKFGYGIYKIKCKIPDGKGMFPAFWLYGEPNGVWNEIDIFEFFNKGNPSRYSRYPAQGTRHEADGATGTLYDCGSSSGGGPDFSNQFHTFTLLWDFYKIEWFIDNVLVRRVTKYSTTLGQQVDCKSFKPFTPFTLSKAYPLEEFQQVILNLAIYADGDAPNPSDVFPKKYEIEYFRYFRQETCKQNVTASDNSSLGMSLENFNAVTGNNVVLKDNVKVNKWWQLNAVAGKSITLKPGFHAEWMSDFRAFINIDLCK